METNFFNYYKLIGQKIDNKIRKLMKIWESPHYLLNGFERKNEETTNTNLNNIISSISEVQKELNEDIKNRHNYLNDMDKFLQDCTTIYNDLKQGVDDIECLFSEYGLSRPPSGLDAKLDTLPLEQIENLNISLRSNSIEQISDEDEEYDTFNNDQFMRSPAMNDANENSLNDVFMTPLRGCPQEPIFSPYYYSNC